MSKHTPEQHRCATRVYGRDGSVFGHQCLRPGKHREGDVWRCDVHCAAAVEKRRAAADARYRQRTAQWTNERKQHERAAACVAALANIPDPAAFVKAARELAEAVGELHGNLFTPLHEAFAAFVAADARPGVTRKDDKPAG